MTEFGSFKASNMNPAWFSFWGCYLNLGSLIWLFAGATGEGCHPQRADGNSSNQPVTAVTVQSCRPGCNWCTSQTAGGTQTHLTICRAEMWRSRKPDRQQMSGKWKTTWSIYVEHHLYLVTVVTAALGMTLNSQEGTFIREKDRWYLSPLLELMSPGRSRSISHRRKTGDAFIKWRCEKLSQLCHRTTAISKTLDIYKKGILASSYG